LYKRYKSQEQASIYSGSYTTEAEQEEFERETGILLDEEAIERARVEERKQSYLNHMKKVLEYMASHGGKTPPDTYGQIGRKLYAVRHSLRNQKLIDENKTPTTQYRTAATSTLSQDVMESLSKAEWAGWEWLATKERTTSNEYSKSLKLPNRTAMNHLKKFQDLGLLEKSGSDRATEYIIRRP